MTSIHACIPAVLRQAVDVAKRRGEEGDSSKLMEEEIPSSVSRVNLRANPTHLRKTLPNHRSRPFPLPLPQASAASEDPVSSDDEEDHDPTKENDPSQSPTLVVQTLRSPRKKVLGKRPLSELPTPTDPEDGMTESEKNIAVNRACQAATIDMSGPAKKSPKLAVLAVGVNASGRLREDACDVQQPIGSCMKTIMPGADEEKENANDGGNRNRLNAIKVAVGASQKSAATPARPTLRKVSNVASSKGKAQARVGIRRL
jgi:ubiquitin-conjugating enzyme E2 S